MKKRLKYYYKHWKLGVHLLFRTYKFGVNNQWWSSFESFFGLPLQRRFHLIKQYKGMKFRAGKLHFLSDESYKLAFGIEKS